MAEKTKNIEAVPKPVEKKKRPPRKGKSEKPWGADTLAGFGIGTEEFLRDHPEDGYLDD